MASVDENGKSPKDFKSTLRIGLADQGLTEIPPKLLRRYGTDVAIVDLTGNNIQYPWSFQVV